MLIPVQVNHESSLVMDDHLHPVKNCGHVITYSGLTLQ